MNLRTGTALLAAGAFIALNFAQSTSFTTTSWDQKRKYDYAIFFKDGSLHCFGSWNSDDLRKLDGDSKQERIFVRKDGKIYVITDRATYDQARKAVQPQMELGRQQGELGKKQGELGKKQGELGRRMGELGRKQGELGRDLGQTVREQLDEERKAAADRKMKQYQDGMKSLGDQMKGLGEKMRGLGAQQGELGKKQGELGRRQGEESRKADKVITELLDRAFEKGLAKEVG